MPGHFPVTVQVKDGAGGTASAGLSINITPPPTSPFGHVFIVAEENANYTDVIGNPSMPYLNGLANQYGLATQYYANITSIDQRLLPVDHRSKPDARQ